MSRIKSEKLRLFDEKAHDDITGNRFSISVSCVENRASFAEKAARAAVSSAFMVGAECIYWVSSVAFPENSAGIPVVHIAFPTDKSDFFEFTNFIYLELLPRVVTTDFNLCVQSDGFAVNAESWDDAFLEYDYVGAPWPWMWGGGPNWAGPIVGNGGFSLRSRKLYKTLLLLNITGETGDLLRDDRIKLREYHTIGPDGRIRIPEDLLISQWFNKQLSSMGVKFCNPNLANQFSVETRCSFTEYWLGKSFGFHGVVAAPHYGVVL